MGRLDGHVLLITGAARGLGEVEARRAVEQGGKVLICDVRDKLGLAVADDLGDAAEYAHVDVSKADHWAAAVATARTRYGHVDVLVNNAAILRVGLIQTFGAQDFRALVDTNQLGPFLGMQAVIPAMRDAGHGSIINVGSSGTRSTG